jgi:histidinol-phosphatase (PHP family)
VRKNLPKVSCGLDQADYHIHPDYSKDATGSIDEYCERALELGLKEICFTTHYDCDPDRKDVDPFMRIDGRMVPLSEEAVKTYIQHVRRADERFRPQGLWVKAGLEVDYAPQLEPMLRKELAHFDLDYTMGAVHCLDHVAISASNEATAYFEANNLETMVSRYYQVLGQAVESGLFDVMAHLDIYKKYGLGFYGEKTLTAHRGLVEPILKIMAEQGVGMEINTGVLRRGHKESSPGLEIVRLGLSMGVKITAFGSDAHKVEQLGSGIQESYAAVEEIRRKLGARNRSFAG